MAQPPYQPPYQQPPYQQPPRARDQQIPAHAHERLTAMRQRKFFTSDLSVNEFLLVKEVGFEPLGCHLAPEARFDRVRGAGHRRRNDSKGSGNWDRNRPPASPR